MPAIHAPAAARPARPLLWRVLIACAAIHGMPSFSSCDSASIRSAAHKCRRAPAAWRHTCRYISTIEAAGGVGIEDGDEARALDINGGRPRRMVPGSHRLRAL